MFKKFIVKSGKETNAAPLFTSKIIALCALSLVSRQSIAQQGCDFGFLVGVQTTTLMNKSDQGAGAQLKLKQNIGFPVGIGMGYTFNKHVGVEVEAIYSTQGQKYTGTSTASPDPNAFSSQIAALANANQLDMSGNFTADVTLRTCKIPILFRYTGDKSKKIFFSSYIGPQFDIFSNAIFHINGYEAPLTNYNVQSESLYNKTTVDGVLGAGAGFNVAPNCVINTTLRVDYGFQDVENKNLSYSYNGGATQKYYTSGRGVTNNMTAGVIVSVSYKIDKKAKEATK